MENNNSASAESGPGNALHVRDTNCLRFGGNKGYQKCFFEEKITNKRNQIKAYLGSKIFFITFPEPKTVFITSSLCAYI